MLLSCTIYCTFHCALLCCRFHVLLSLLLITLESKRCQSNDSTLLFIKDLPSVSQSNVQAVTAETEVQYTLSNIIYFKFQNCCFFFCQVYFEGGAPKMHTSQIFNGVHFFGKFAGWGSATLPKICSSTKIFQDFCADLMLSIKVFSKFYKLLFPRKSFSGGC